MAALKMTKNELRLEQVKLGQLQKYLPTLQLKKAMLQAEVFNARIEVETKEQTLTEKERHCYYIPVLAPDLYSFDLEEAGEAVKVTKEYENIAGVEIPQLRGIEFATLQYGLFETPPWVDAAVASLRAREEARISLEVAVEKKAALEKELRDVSIRVNLFEKVLIPRTTTNIKKIKVFLGDQQLAAVGQAKVAKAKIEARRQSDEVTLES